MTCLRIPGRGFMCVADIRHIIHKGRRWHFGAHKFLGLSFCNRDGDDVECNHVPQAVVKAVFDILDAEREHGKYIGPCSDCGGPVFAKRDGEPPIEGISQQEYEEFTMCHDCQVKEA